MRLCVFGAGAIGGYLAARLARVEGLSLSLVARGAQLEAIQTGGLRLIEDGSEHTVAVRATGDAAELGPQDVVVLALKAHAVSAALDAVAPLLGPDTAVVTAQNGVPWWYFHEVGGPFDGRHVEAVDPGGRILRQIGAERAIGCIVYPATEVAAPGVVRHLDGNRFALGEPSGARTARVKALSEALIAAGLKAPVRPDIRTELWVKLWGNLAFNPISALTGATLGEIVADPATRRLARAMMLEAEAIAVRLGVRLPVDVDRRIDGAGAVGAHKTSMLQDLERGRKMEIDANVTAVQELGRLVDVPTPTIDAVLALVSQRARLAGCYP